MAIWGAGGTFTSGRSVRLGNLDIGTVRTGWGERLVFAVG
jgi:hypothetical protein